MRSLSRARWWVYDARTTLWVSAAIYAYHLRPALRRAHAEIAALWHGVRAYTRSLEAE